MVRTLVNFVLFQAGWLACVMGAARGRHWLAVAAVAVVTIVHLAMQARPGRAVLLLAAAAALGVAVDTALVWARVYEPVRWVSPAPLTTVWLVLMWVNFATTMDGCLAWLQGRRWLGAVLGAAGGPMAYYAGERLQALVIHRPLPGSLAAIAIAWAVAVPVLAEMARRLTSPPRLA